MNLVKNLGGAAALVAFSMAGVANSCDRVINFIQYCNMVESITYENVGFSGSYIDITGMDPTTCKCTTTQKSFSGPLAPLDEGLSLHFRGPLALKQFAVYTPNTAASKEKREAHVRQHARHARHARRAALAEANPDIIIVTNTITKTAYYFTDATEFATMPAGEASQLEASLEVEDSTGSTEPLTVQTTSTAGPSANKTTSSVKTFEMVSSATKSTASPSTGTATGAYKRTGYYSSEKGISDGLMFLNNMGGQGSGTFDYCFGNSLSYMNADNTAGSSTPECLVDKTIPSGTEFSIWTDQKCDEASCGYYRPNIPAYRGFEGSNKIFLFEFKMPHDSSGPENSQDMPAIWALNGKISRTTQYGSSDCNCWLSGCGELDLFEVLTGATDYVKTTYHSTQGTNNQYGGGGSPDYFKRPVDETIKAAVVFDGSKNIHITIVDGSAEFSETLSPSFVDSCAQTVSVFSISS